MKYLVKGSVLLLIAFTLSFSFSLNGRDQGLIDVIPDGDVDCRCKNTFSFGNKCKAAVEGSSKTPCSPGEENKCWTDPDSC